MTTCKYTQCSKDIYAKELCRLHYNKADFRPKCKISNCTKPIRGRGLCGGHYNKLLKYGAPDIDKKPKPRYCKIDGCNSRAPYNWLCQKHHLRLAKHGDVNYGKNKRVVSGTPEYRTWIGIKQRCNNPNNVNYYKYGGRGIKMCNRWQESFESFYRDMGKKPSPKHSIERIDNDGDYEPSNCKWATWEEQFANRSVGRENPTGYTGVYKHGNLFYARVTKGGKSTVKRRFVDAQSAHEWRTGLLHTQSNDIDSWEG